MKVITIEEHIASEEVIKALLTKQLEDGEINPDRMKFFQEKSFVGGKLIDVENERIPFMDKVGIDMQVLSYINPINDTNIPKNIKTKNCLKANNFLKSIIDKYPDRFSAFAYLPLWDVDASVKELERCVNELGFKGALVTGKVDGHFLDEKEYFPIFQKAEELNVPIHFHPSMPVKEIHDYYYTSRDESWSDEIANQFGSAAFGWHLDIGIQVVRMILTGIFDKLPNLKLITGHWGEGIIEMLDRLDYMIPKSMTGFKKNI